MFNKIKRRIGAALIAATAVVSQVVSVGAESTDVGSGLTPEVQAQIQGQFESMSSDIMAVIVPIIGVGLGIFALILGVKFGKKMFKTVSNG